MGEKTFTSTYYLTSPYDTDIVLPAEGSKDWERTVNDNLREVDEKLHDVETAAAINTTMANSIGGGGVAHVNQLTNPDFTQWRALNYVSPISKSNNVDEYTTLTHVAVGWCAFAYPVASTNSLVGLSATDTGAVVQSGVGAYEIHLIHRMENPLPYRGKVVTFAVDIRPVVNGTYRARIVDYVAANREETNTSSTMVASSSYTRLLVTRTIRSTATMVEVRIVIEATDTSVPQDACECKNAMFVIGNFTELSYVPNKPGVDALQCARYYERIPSNYYEEFKESIWAGASVATQKYTISIRPKTPLTTVNTLAYTPNDLGNVHAATWALTTDAKGIISTVEILDAGAYSYVEILSAYVERNFW